MMLSKEIKNRIKKGFDVKIETDEKFYFFYKQEFTNGEIGGWCCDIYEENEIVETNFFDTDDDVIDEIKSI